MPFTFERLEISDIILIKPIIRKDVRGYFLEAYKKSEFSENGIDIEFIQDNFSHSVHGVVRGLHYQKNPRAQAKLVRVIGGEIFDVAVDIRRGSPTFGKWVGQRLTAENKYMLYIPPGFAHGFCVLSGEADVLYKASDEYAPDHDRGILWNDPVIGIDWQLANPIVSEKDANLLPLSQADNNFFYEGK
ncbi:MAG: dTDP-4-dehydrorhamnose 3,5-epimerase [Calditrichaeota bacterium]|nr:dTDP-4-dehydrorhamnose 3,5-epimerase [Calditrichota bacterium]